MTPAVWLSTHPLWEPIAVRVAVGADGTERPISMEELFRRDELVRIGVDQGASLLSFREYARRCGFGRPCAKRIERSIRDRGGDPARLRACLRPIPSEMWTEVDLWTGHSWAAAAYQLRHGVLAKAAPPSVPALGRMCPAADHPDRRATLQDWLGDGD